MKADLNTIYMSRIHAGLHQITTVFLIFPFILLSSVPDLPQADDVPGSVTRTVAGASIYVNMRFGDFLGSIQMGCELSGQFRTYIESLSGIADAEVSCCSCSLWIIHSV